MRSKIGNFSFRMPQHMVLAFSSYTSQKKSRVMVVRPVINLLIGHGKPNDTCNTTGLPGCGGDDDDEVTPNVKEFHSPYSLNAVSTFQASSSAADSDPELAKGDTATVLNSVSARKLPFCDVITQAIKSCETTAT